MGRFPMILVVGPNSDVKDAKDFVAKAKAAPARSATARPVRAARTTWPWNCSRCKAVCTWCTSLPRRSPALTDLAGGQVAAMMVDLAAGAGFIKGGKCARWRWPTPPACPSCLTCPPLPNWASRGRGSLGPGGHCGPCNTPADTVAALQKQVPRPSSNRPSAKSWIDFGIEPVGTPQQYAELIRTEVQRWHQLIREQKISLD